MIAGAEGGFNTTGNRYGGIHEFENISRSDINNGSDK